MNEREIKKLELQNGSIPFDQWFNSLRDKRMQAAVDARLTRIRGGGVYELRIALDPDCASIMGCTAEKSSFCWVAETRAARHGTSGGAVALATIYETCV